MAQQYLLMMKKIGVGIGLHKSLVSRKGVLEFAKRFFIGKEDCSPLPVKEFAAGTESLNSAVELGFKYKASSATLLGLAGFGYRVKSFMTAPFRKLNPRARGLLVLTAFKERSLLE